VLGFVDRLAASSRSTEQQQREGCPVLQLHWFAQLNLIQFYYTYATNCDLRANFVHQMFFAGLIEHLSPYSGCISEWISFATSPFAHKIRIIARYLSQDNFNSNVTIFNIYKWHHHNKTHSWYSELNSLQNVYFGFFILGKLTEWCHFVTYLWNNPGMYASAKSVIYTVQIIRKHLDNELRIC